MSEPVIQPPEKKEPPVKVSGLLFRAELAAFQALPPKSRALIEKQDAEFALWDRKLAVPAALTAAREAVLADALAACVLQLRVMANDAFTAEWTKERGL